MVELARPEFQSVVHPITEQRGEPIIVFIPGGPGLSSHTLPVQDVLPQFQLMVVDPPGTGGQAQVSFEGLSARVAFDAVVDSICRAVISATTDQQSLVIAGHSFGGIQATDCAARLHAESRHVVGLLLISSAFTQKLSKVLVQIVNAKGSEELKAARNAYNDSPGVDSYRSYAASYGRLLYGPSEEVGERIIELLRTDPCCGCAMAAFGSILGQVTRNERLLMQLPMAKAAIIGDCDALVPADISAREAERLGVSAHVIANAGHFPFLDNPTSFHDIVRDCFCVQSVTDCHGSNS